MQLKLGHFLALLGGLLLLLGAVSVLCGLLPVSPAHLLTGTLTPQETSVVWFIRLPRFVCGAAAGAALALAGAVLQGLFGNPLADPGLLGVSGGACLGAVLALLSGFSLRYAFVLPLGAFCGALAATGAVSLLARRARPGGEGTALLLGGVAIGVF